MVRPADRIRILIVDDADEVRRDLRTIFCLLPDLEVAGEATHGLQAVSLAQQLRPDVVLMDLRLPGLDGFEAAQRIKSQGLAGAVVMLSIYAHEENRARAAAIGADGFVDKAAGVEPLLAAIRQVAPPRTRPAGGAGGQPTEVANGI